MDEKQIFLVLHRGAPVLVVKALKDRAFSMGLTVMGQREYQRCVRGQAQTLDHEYGHLLQLLILGLPVYLVLYALPSFVCHWSGVPERRYYNLPWEYIADRLGGVRRKGPHPRLLARCYFLFSLILCWTIRILIAVSWRHLL
jgi:hypothetical protein